MAQKWFNVEFYEDDIYVNNLQRFCAEMLPRCKWSLLPFGFLYDLYESWFPKVGLYEKPQTKKVFVKRLTDYLKSDATWTIENHYVPVDKNNMPLPEPLILEFNLKNWMNNDYDGDNPDIICSPALKSKYLGICRNGIFG